MKRLSDPGMDIGQLIQRRVIPADMSVTEAAKKLGVSRPALSKLLNNRVGLSPNMALRLEKTFGADREELLSLEAASRRDRRHDQDRAVSVGAYVPDFLSIRAREIEGWAASISAREHFPVLLRGLVRSAGRELHHLDFPGFDNAQRHGWDGWVEAGAATPWVPAGKSGWELGVGQHPSAKADADYRNRLRMVAPADRAYCTFVFVTPRNWAGKGEWARERTASGDWKAVRALDASDLEQWLETTVAPRIWLAEKLGKPTTGYQTIEAFWGRWSAGSEPPMTPAIFRPSLDRHREKVHLWLNSSPDRPFLVAADSKQEAVAFIACLLQQDDLAPGARDRAVLFESADTLQLLAQSSSRFIPVVWTKETERVIGDVYRRHHCIVVRPRNAVDREPDISVELLGHEAFATALASMGITERERVGHLARETGRSPTVLRRRLSVIPAIRTPAWAGDTAIARRLIPMTLVGAWYSGSNADREVLAALAGRSYEEIEEGIADLLGYDDCPVWCVDQYRGVVSKIDALFAIAPSMTEKDIVDFVRFAEYVLSEADPALELPEDKRWKAGLYGKVREHSATLRTGVCETLVLLAVHGNSLFQERLGINVETQVSGLVYHLLTPLTNDKLLSHVDDMPSYAEAAPDTFLTLLEEDLGQPEPVLRTLLQPVGPSPFNSPVRTGVLWALERLAWHPRNLMRAVLILADLSRTKIDDNWVNRPINSLAAIFRSWLPQTAASIADRIMALEALCTHFPDIGWQICSQQLDTQLRRGAYSAKPRWRSDASGAGERVSAQEDVGFISRAFDLAVAWSAHDASTLGDLAEHLDRVHPTHQLRVWEKIDAWSRAEKVEGEKAELRERIRQAIPVRDGTLYGLAPEVNDLACRAYASLEPSDPVIRHSWLFAESCVKESAGELTEADFDWEERAERVHALRAAAMAEIWSTRGLDGALALLPRSYAPWEVGRYVASCAAHPRSTGEVLQQCLSSVAAPPEKVDDFIRGFLLALDDETRADVLSSSARIEDAEQITRLFGCAPFNEQTWQLLAKQARNVRDQYWRHVRPGPRQFTAAEANELVHRLLSVDRPRAAFASVRFWWDKVETSQLRCLLLAVATVDNESGDFPVDPYCLSEALDSLGGRPGVTPDEMAQLEFAFVTVLRFSKHGIPNLERSIRKSPALFVQILALIFRRRDGGQDPAAWHVDDPIQHASASYELLERLQRIPGEDAHGQIDPDELMRWVTEARRLYRKHGRIEIGDERIGQWLSRKSSQDEGRWPCRSVCDVLARAGSEDMAKGFEIGVYNGRGVTNRGLDEGGRQEHDLAAKYRAWAREWRFEYPFVSRILDAIANGYEQQGTREDTEMRVRERLENQV